MTTKKAPKKAKKDMLLSVSFDISAKIVEKPAGEDKPKLRGPVFSDKKKVTVKSILVEESVLKDRLEKAVSILETGDLPKEEEKKDSE